MKSFTILAAIATAVTAQSLTDLPTCGQTCISNMLSIASADLGCSAGDAVCYCSKQDFGYGVRDCANQHCSSADAGSVIAFGVSYCAGVLASAGTTGSALAPLTSALATVTTIDLATITGTGGSGGQSTAITTQPLVATLTGTDGSTFETTTGFATIYSSISGDASGILSSLDSAASSASGSLASAASSVAASLSSARSSALASITGAASSALSSGASELSSLASSLATQATGASTGGSPMITGMPFAGAAGMAAWFLL